jgi:hypothetical protein
MVYTGEIFSNLHGGLNTSGASGQQGLSVDSVTVLAQQTKNSEKLQQQRSYNCRTNPYIY